MRPFFYHRDRRSFLPAEAQSCGAKGQAGKVSPVFVGMVNHAAQFLVIERYSLSSPIAQVRPLTKYFARRPPSWIPPKNASPIQKRKAPNRYWSDLRRARLATPTLASRGNLPTLLTLHLLKRH